MLGRSPGASDADCAAASRRRPALHIATNETTIDSRLFFTLHLVHSRSLPLGQ